MRIVLDMQGVQVALRRGEVEPLDLRFAWELLHYGRQHTIMLALNGAFQDTIEPVRALFYGRLPQDNIRVWYAPDSVRTHRKIPEWLREAFLASLDPDVIHVGGLYEGIDEGRVFSVGAWDTTTPVSLMESQPGVPVGMGQKRWNSLCQHRRVMAGRAAWRFSAGHPVADVLAAWEAEGKRQVAATEGGRPRLAFVTPLPPAQTGVADYAVELLPLLARHYEIDLVVTQDQVDLMSVQGCGTLRDVAWLREQGEQLERVLYHVGNSPYHVPMLELLKEVPGTVVLHDFFLSGLMSSLGPEAEGQTWHGALYVSHGHVALRDDSLTPRETHWHYPVNWPVLSQAQGVIVHSRYAQILARQWWGEGVAQDWRVIPLLRAPAPLRDRNEVRRRLGYEADQFLVCSFGMTGATKLNDRLLSCWLDSCLAKDERARLVFVGENEAGDYGARLLQIIRERGMVDRVQVTGFVQKETFQDYLDAADMAVQLRTLSRGETSAAVLDCMNHGLPVVVNAHGSAAEQDSGGVWMLPDAFEDRELISAIETLYQDAPCRVALGEKARQIVHSVHDPAGCAQLYAEAIESFHAHRHKPLRALIQAMADQATWHHDDPALLELAHDLAVTFPMPRPQRRLFLDVSAICRDDLKTGIQRVVRALICALLELPDVPYRIEPVYIVQHRGVFQFCYARCYTARLLGYPDIGLPDDPLDPQAGDVMLALDLAGGWMVGAERSGLIRRYRELGVSVHAVVYDLLPLRLPLAFPPGAEEGHRKWLEAITTFDGAIGISRRVADDVRAWLAEEGIQRVNQRPYDVRWFHLGADVENTFPSRGLPPDAEQVLRQLRAAPSFLMVGTVEPRKGHALVVDAFEQLLQEDCVVNLVIVGKQGWMVDELADKLRMHQERQRHLFWLEGVSDEYLEALYACATCLVAASLDEGFGLPLIEAAQHGLPILARDIPVFREVAGEHADYFTATTGQDLARCLRDWLASHQRGTHAPSSGMPWLTWRDSARQLLGCLPA